jgi:integrase
MALHTHQANPHVHLLVRAESDLGVRLNPRKADLHEWRMEFAAELRGWTDRPIGRRIQLLPGERPRETNLTTADVRRLASKADPRLRDLIVFQALTGLRRSEALRLTAADVVDGCVRVDSRSKNGKPRLVPLAPEAAKIARRLPFTLTVAQVVRLWGKARAAARMPGVRLHDLRHHFCTQLVAGGANAAVVRDLAGHSSLAVTSRYTASVPEAAVRAVGKLTIGGRLGAGKQPEGHARR